MDKQVPLEFPPLLHTGERLSNQSNNRDTVLMVVQSDEIQWVFEDWKHLFGEEGVSVVVPYLKTNTTITSLNLKNTQSNDSGIQMMIEALQCNMYSKLTTLILSENKIGNKGLVCISAFLKYNRSMKYLDLRENIIGDEGACCLAEALEINSSLTTLDLTGNWISDKGANKMASALSRNSTLLKFLLVKNRISEEGMKKILRALQDNIGLEELHFRDNLFSPHSLQPVVVSTLKMNASLTKLDWNMANDVKELLSINTNFYPWRRMALAWPKTHFLYPYKNNEKNAIEYLLIIFYQHKIPKEIKIAIIRTVILTKQAIKIVKMK